MGVLELKVIKCLCGDKVCDYHHINFGSFDQGCGWDHADAIRICEALALKFPQDFSYEHQEVV